MLAGGLDGRHVALACDLAVRGALRPGRRGGRRGRLGQRHHQPLHRLARADQRHRAADVVERHHRVGQHEAHQRQARVVGVGGRQRHRLQLRRPVVAEVADRSAHERRVAGAGPGAGGGERHRLLQRVGGLAAGRQEAVPAHLLAPLDRLQQEGRRAQRLAQQQVGADRRQQVCGKRSDDAVVCHWATKKPPAGSGERPVRGAGAAAQLAVRTSRGNPPPAVGLGLHGSGSMTGRRRPVNPFAPLC